MKTNNHWRKLKDEQKQFGSDRCLAGSISRAKSTDCPDYRDVGSVSHYTTASSRDGGTG